MFNNSKTKKEMTKTQLAITLIITLFITVTGATYAYFALVLEDNDTIAGETATVNLNLNVTKIFPLATSTNTGVMVPQISTSGSNTSPLSVALKKGCIDDNENIVCQVYKIVVKNTGGTATQVADGIVQFYSDANLTTDISKTMPNLKWKLVSSVNENLPIYSELGTNIDQVASSSEDNVFANDIVMETDSSFTYYIIIWINETNTNQTKEPGNTYYGKISFNSSNGTGVTSAFGEGFSNDDSSNNTDTKGPNAPNLDSGNLIPVYFDEFAGTTGEWKKADSSNSNNSWYNYDNKMWANAVIINSDATTDYSTASVGTTVADADITAFYVWIPRYKYRVWNITRQGGEESTYAYPAYSQGIDIEFENGTDSTGNVESTYDVTTPESETNLSDVCIYNGTDTITTTSGNTNYTEAWYTHPAFTFGNDEKTGFWIGKFETTGSTTAPTVLPDVVSLREQTVSKQFTTSKKFQTNLSSNIDAHMLTNLEWGAVAYLTHSIYGLCDGTSCGGVYINNSSSYYTGRSGGAIAGNTALNLSNIYPESTTDTLSFNSTGYYDYKGYFIDYSGTVTTTKDISKIASTTRNITGVYDMSGGAYEYVMGNMADQSYNFYPSKAGANWNGSTSLDFKYYNSYSYGTNYYKTIAFNRARLGDATSEVLGSATVRNGAWKVGSGITGSTSYFTSNTVSWFGRGGSYNNTSSGSFYFDRSYGISNTSSSSFRSSLS